MDAQTCLKKMQLAGTLSLATVDENGAPQIRCVSAVHYESRAIYFLLPTFIPVIRVISTLSLRSKTSCSTTLTWGFVLLSALSLP